MSLHEIVLPETKPESEWILGRAVRKVSPTYPHGVLQLLIGGRLLAWASAGGHGRVASEWRFRIAPPGEIVRPFVPDVAYLSYAALPRESAPGVVAAPLCAPTVAVEILSPDDRPRNVAHKIETYRAAGSAAVIVVDPDAETLVRHDETGSQTYRTGDTIVHASLPGFTLDVRALFEEAAR